MMRQLLCMPGRSYATSRTWLPLRLASLLISRMYTIRQAQASGGIASPSSKPHFDWKSSQYFIVFPLCRLGRHRDVVGVDPKDFVTTALVSLRDVHHHQT